MIEKMYHVFTDGRDEYFERYDDAKKLYDEWAQENDNVRLYLDTQKDGEPETEDFIEGKGAFPW